MDKKEMVIQSEKFIPKSILYGTISGIQIKEFIESRADKIVKDDWTIEDIALRIKESLYGKETGEPLFTSAEERVSLPLSPVVSSPSSKVDYINSFISRLPYKGDIRVGVNPTDIINIEQEIKSLSDRMNDDNTISLGDNNISLKDYYHKLLNQEYIPPMLIDKLDVILAAVEELRNIYPNYDDLSVMKINNKSFMDLLLELPNKMLDNFDVKDRLDVMSIGDYLSREFKKVSEYAYNSVNSKPNNVELIGVEYNEDHKFSVTNEYIFLSPEEENSLIEGMRPRTIEEERSELHRTMLGVIDGINKSLNIDTLSKYEEYFTKIIETIKTKFPDDNFLKELYTKMLEIYNKVDQELRFIQDNDDIRYMVGQDLKDIKLDYKDVTTDFHRTLEDNSDDRRKIISGIRTIKKNSSDMAIQGLHHELDELDKEMIKDNISRYGMNNTNHDIDRVKNSIEDFMRNIKSESRALNFTSDARALAALQISLERDMRDLNRLLTEANEKGLISDAEKEEYENGINSKGGKNL